MNLEAWRRSTCSALTRSNSMIVICASINRFVRIEQCLFIYERWFRSMTRTHTHTYAHTTGYATCDTRKRRTLNEADARRRDATLLSTKGGRFPGAIPANEDSLRGESRPESGRINKGLGSMKNSCSQLEYSREKFLPVELHSFM